MPTTKPLRIARSAAYQPLPDDAPVLEKRNRLAELLAEAAEFEHNVLCQYLFAACSFKRHPDEGGVSWQQLECMRRWEAALLGVARQEMEHLGLVNNMLTAIGEAPHLTRPNFPFASPYRSVEVPFTLTPFSRETLRRFICLEMPSELSPANEKWLAKKIPGFAVSRFDGLVELYTEIGRLFGQIDEAVLFVGPRTAQFHTLEIIPGSSIRGVPMSDRMPRYNVMMLPVTDRQSALDAVNQITSEGEGASVDSTNSHFYTFLSMYKELDAALRADRGFAPARDVGPNPILVGDIAVAATEPTTLIDNPPAVLLSRLFDASYSTMMLILLRYFTHTDETQAQLDALQQAAFFPLMTAVIRPLAEVLTGLPASPASPDLRAGPAFRFPLRLAFLPHRKAAWKVIDMQLKLMTDLAGEAQGDPAYSEPARRRLAMIYQNIARIAMAFEENMQTRQSHD